MSYSTDPHFPHDSYDLYNPWDLHEQHDSRNSEGLPYSHISSLYGPGTVACWIFTVASVLATWILNPPYRRKDSITSDLVAALSFPTILVGHLIYLVVQSHVDTSTNWGNSIAACMNVFDTFGAFLLLLFCLALSKSNRKRTILLSVAFLFYVIAQIADANESHYPDYVSRSWIHNRSHFSYLERIEVIIVIGLLISLLSYGASFLYVLTHKSGFPPKFNFQPLGRKHLLQAREKFERYLPRIQPLLGLMKAPLALLSFVLTVKFITMICSQSIDLESILWAFIPRTGISLATWDQAGALACGALAFVFSLLHATIGLAKDMMGPKEEEEVKPPEAIDLEAMWA